LSADPYTNSTSQHATEVEPSSSAFGATIVTAFQVGRIFGGGGADVGFSTSTDGGFTWVSGLLPGITTFQGGGTYSAVSDAVVAYDRAHATWLISTLPIGTLVNVAVNRSSDGINWGDPVLVTAMPNTDKNWIACDSNPSSHFYGHCYVEWDDPGTGLIWMSTSIDGGQTWSSPLNGADKPTGVGGVPVVQPNGTVVVPLPNQDGTKILSFSSADGGTTWDASVAVSPVNDHLVAGNLRTSPLPASAVDNAGTVYVVWQDCSFRSGCGSNDLVMSTSVDGKTWSALSRIPIDAVGSTVDHFIPGLAMDPSTGGAGAHLALAYYEYSTAACTPATCAMNAGFISSSDGGATWSAPQMLAGPMSLGWLPNTFAGLMVGDYVTAAFSQGRVYPIIAVAQAPAGSELNEAIYTVANGLSAASVERRSSLGELVLPGAHSDHPPRTFRDAEPEP
jgi:hypothetical protein